eukprot:789332-Pleurochrysis_carterae.AAC.1
MREQSQEQEGACVTYPFCIPIVAIDIRSNTILKFVAAKRQRPKKLIASTRYPKTVDVLT